MENKEEIVREYSNKEMTVVWKPHVCIHAKYCWQDLPEVFNPNNRPWVNVHGASSERIAQQVKKCPSGALSYFYNEAQKETNGKEIHETCEVDVQAIPGGPLLINGNISFTDENSNLTRKSGKTAFCRCRQSNNLPYCDGSHLEIKTGN
ncbi:MAG: (4Fe-4S)-binding protein [Candidatus Symbiothrix sp.]|jgi:uncharacterized Fe-S cluster protein YjdI|nr:(4Fe-4S)-binding protein [Candidatus Symbiothrix sp.]